jgi:subtilisin family serine protease
MEVLVPASHLCIIIILSLLFFCIVITLQIGNIQIIYGQKCYNDPDSPSKPCDQTPQAGESVTQTAPPQENEIIDPGIQANEPTEESSDQTQQNNDETNQDQNENKKGDEQHEKTNQNQNEKKKNDSGSKDDDSNTGPDTNKKNTANNDKLIRFDNKQNNNFSKLFSNSQSHLTNCLTPSNQSDIFSNSTMGSLEVIFYGSTSGSINPINIQITPNPFTLDKTPIFIRDNQEGDCNNHFDILSLPNIRYSFYTVKQYDEYGNVIRSFQIPVNKQWPSISVNIHNRTFTKDIPKFEVIPNQYLVKISDGVKTSAEEVASSFSSQTNAKILKVFDNTRAFSFAIKNEDIGKMEKILSTDSRLRLAEQNVVGRLAQLESQTIPTGVKRVVSGATQFGLYTSASSQRNVDADIAIIDTGIDLNHPDLNVYKNVSFVNGTILGNDDNGHGSEVAGIAAARNNMLGVIGMAPGAKLWAIKVCTSVGKCPLASQIEGIEYAIDHSDEIDVMNISIENPFSSILNASIARAAEKGIVVVAASGNDAKDASNITPANSPDVISVSGLADSDGKCGGLGPITTYGKDDTLADFSNFGEVIDIASPAVDILTTYNNSDYSVDSGTSFAAPHVSGAAALMKSENKNITVAEVRDRLINIGSSAVTKCDGKGKGYFLNDPDTFREHLLYLNGTLHNGFNELQKLSGPQHTGLPIVGFRSIAK